MVSVPTKPRRETWARKSRKQNILTILKTKGPQTNSNLKKLANLWQSPLSSLLGDLIFEKKVLQTVENGEVVFTITKEGEKSILDIGILGILVSQIMEHGGIYHDDYSNMYGSMFHYYQLPWGIQDDIVFDHNLKRHNPISEEIVGEIHKTLYNSIKENVKSGKIRFDSTKEGKIVLGFVVDYQNLVKSINEQSLSYLENMPQKEREFFDRIGDRTLTKKEQEELVELRKQGKAKLGVKLR